MIKVPLPQPMLELLPLPQVFLAGSIRMKVPQQPDVLQGLRGERLTQTA